MPLRCLLFCSDDEASQPVIRVLAELQIDVEHCPDAATATQRVTVQQLQILILDWDDQPEAPLLLNAARMRKASERPLILAMVGDDAGVSRALQAGANSILRKPILPNQARDTITTARDLLRAKLEQSASAAKAFAARASAGASTPVDPAPAATLRAGEFLQSPMPQPGAQFTTDSDLDKRMLQSQRPVEIDPLKDLEPTAGALNAKDETETATAPVSSQPRGLAWYKARKSALASAAAPAPALSPPSFAESASESTAGKTELLSYEQTPSYTATPARPPTSTPGPALTEFSEPQPAIRQKQSDQDTESELFAYLARKHVETAQPAPAASAPSPNRLRLVAAFFCVVIFAGVGYWKLPQSLGKARLESVSSHVASAIHVWLNPQPVTPASAAPTHENFAHAGDEYKLPVAEAIPDATTDPSQIHVLPVIDPTLKPKNAANTGANPPGADGTTVPNPTDQQTVTPSPDNSSTTTPNSASPTQTATQPATSSTPIAQTNSAPASVKPLAAAPVSAPIQRNPQPQYTAVATGIPSSLKSQMASSTPEASGNKPPEAAMPSIEPVNLPEGTARNLLLQQAAPAYPESAKGQSGTVVLQVLVGRDGTVQDAKFLQGSLVFARSAIDAVKKWRFQPYTMNGHPVSTVTSLTVSFKPAS